MLQTDHLNKLMDLSVADPLRTTSVAYACSIDDTQTLQQLIQKGSSISCRDNRSWTPLIEAASHGHNKCVEILLKHDKSPQYLNSSSYTRSTALLVAVSRGHVTTSRLLVTSGADVNIPNLEDYTPLHLAVRAACGKAPLENILDAPSASPGRGDRGSNTAGSSDQASSSGDGAVDSASQGDGGKSVEVTDENLELVRLLLSNGADPNRANYNDYYPLHYAAEGGQTDVIPLLLENGAKLDVYTECHLSPVFLAAWGGHAEALEYLLDAAQRQSLLDDLVNLPARDGATPLYIAAQSGDVSCVRLLLSRGADANTPTTEYPVALPIHAAAEHNEHTGCLELLFPATDMAAVSRCDLGLLTVAISKPHSVRFLLDQAGLDPDAEFVTCDDYYMPQLFHFSHLYPLHLPLRHSSMVTHVMNCYRGPHTPSSDIMLELLLDRGASVNPRRRHELPAILEALQSTNLHRLKLLLSAGVSLDVRVGELTGNMVPISAMLWPQGFDFLLRYGAPVTDLLEERSHGEHACLALMMASCRRFLANRGRSVSEICLRMLQLSHCANLSPSLRAYCEEDLPRHAHTLHQITDITASPRTLQHLSRVAVRSALGQTYRDQRAMMSLPVPKLLVDYLLFKELLDEDTLIEQNIYDRFHRLSIS